MRDTTTNDELLTAEQVAAMLHLHIATVWRYVREGKLRAVRLSNRGNIRIRQSELDRYLSDLETGKA
jgi:excisionase family DNA binding protein